MTCCKVHPLVMTPEEEQRELEDPLEWLPAGELERRSGVARFYEGASVFITGATGFIGTLILEKLLRSCPGISTIYVLMRDKKGVPLRERLRSHMEKEIFCKARAECPNYLSKVVPIAGDCTKPGLGISPDDAALLASKVSVVFHIAATVRFDADLRTAAITNVGATYDIITLARRMPNLKAFIYMSTAYSNAYLSEIDEQFYPCALNREELLRLVNVMDDEQLAQILPLLLGEWPNTYTFTKAIAEDLIRTEGTGLPVSVIRPSIVTNTYYGPLVLWVGNMYGPTALGAGVAMGVMHTMLIDGKALADNVPADMVANATIACAWDTWCRHSRQTQTQTPAEPLIYNCVSTPRHPITWEDALRFSENGTEYMSINTIWHACGIPFKHKFLYVICAVFFHLIPAALADTYLTLSGKKAMLWKIYSRIHGITQALEKFTTRSWTFKEDNMVSLLGRLQPADHKLFPCDVAAIDYEWHVGNYMRGLRPYVFNESYDNLEAAKKRYARLVVLHYVVVTIVCSPIILLLWRMIAARTGL